MAITALKAQVSIGGYNVYYGTLHNHSNVSDGQGTPADAYNYAKNTSHLDFFSLADHSGSITSTEWDAIKAAANTYNQDGSFAAFWGFEWSSSGSYGHVAVINTEDYCTTASPTNTFTALCDWLNTRECVAFFNHPGRENSSGNEFNHFSTTPSTKLVGMELWNKTDGFTDYYYNDGYYAGDGNKGYFDEAITRNWKIGASGSEDNHWASWGNYCNYRLAVLANAKTRSDIYAAFQTRRFYSTLDKNIALSFKINGSEMGSTVTAGNFTLQIQAQDGDGEIFTSVKLVRNGAVVQAWAPNVANPDITGSVACSNADYFYVIIHEADGDEAISSPIWCSSGANQSPVVSITGPAGNSTFDEPTEITISADASDPDGIITKVEFYQGSTKLGEDIGSPFSFTWANVYDGNYNLTAVATDNAGAQTTSSTVSVTVTALGYHFATSRIVDGMDDVEENAAGVMYTNSTDIELVYDAYNSNGNQVVGLRFQNPGIPPGAELTNAYIQFTTDEATSAACDLTVRGENSDNSTAFTSSNFNVSARPVTSALATWSPAAWNVPGEAGQEQRTPDLSAVLQEIVNRPGHTSSSPITVIITGTSTVARIAEAVEGTASQAAQLNVFYTLAPVADFIADQTEIVLGGAVQFTDLSTREPVAYFWDFPGGTPATSMDQDPQVTYNTPGVYPVTLIVSNAGGPDTLIMENYIHVAAEPTYCASQSTDYSVEYITKFTVGTFVKTSTGSYYSDFTGNVINLLPNTKYTARITPKFNGPKKVEYFKVWIDYNQDLDFDDAGENVVSGQKNGELSASFKTPATVTGSTRLRVSMKRTAYPGTCETFTYGEVEDYTVSFGSKSMAGSAPESSADNPSTAIFRIYPNPATKNLNILRLKQSDYDAELYSNTGQVIWKSRLVNDLTTIDINHLRVGLYLFRYNSPDGGGTLKVIIY